ncbi:MAG TPA: class I SAM-dependent methyltransferase [Acidimicrobiales bacterium]|nr:class I SAM-dependent methyltransferase [Acidimicrobiales bacterium]
MTLESRLAAVAARVAPETMRTPLRRIYRSFRPLLPVAAPAVTLPPDVADGDALRAYLRDTDIFGQASGEADDYVFDSFERFRTTMALVPPLAPAAKVLELGANPYFITRLLLRRGLDVTCANWFGEESGFKKRDVQEVRGPRSREFHRFEFEHFNVETQPFPYESGAFDLVLCCEIIEHLPNDPTHMLAEIHRVTRKPGGRLILTTPNAVRYDNLRRMERGENVYEELSGYGTYGRHNREYTVEELVGFLTSLGFAVESAFSADVHPTAFPPAAYSPDVNPSQRGDNLFVVARPEGEPRWKYPRWLYTSQHAIRRIVRDDLVMGVNDDLQSRGFHQLETIGGREIRWMGLENAARVWLRVPQGQSHEVVIQGLGAPGEVAGPIELSLRCGEQQAVASIESQGAPFEVRLPIRLSGEVEVELTTDRTFVPADIGVGQDRRSLSLAVSRVAAA